MAFEFSACDYEEMKWGTFSVVGLYAGDVIMAVNSSGKEASIRKVAKGGLIGVCSVARRLHGVGCPSRRPPVLV